MCAIVAKPCCSRVHQYVSEPLPIPLAQRWEPRQLRHPIQTRWSRVYGGLHDLRCLHMALMNNGCEQVRQGQGWGGCCRRGCPCPTVTLITHVRPCRGSHPASTCEGWPAGEQQPPRQCRVVKRCRGKSWSEWVTHGELLTTARAEVHPRRSWWAAGATTRWGYHVVGTTRPGVLEQLALEGASIGSRQHGARGLALSRCEQRA